MNKNSYITSTYNHTCKNVYVVAHDMSIILVYIININKYTKHTTHFPKIIWTYWQSNIPPTITKCIQTWRKHNPSYTINVLSRSNISKYLPSVDFLEMKGNDSITREADLVRLNILARHGGFWMDASLITTAPLDWIQERCKDTNIEYFGYYLENWITDDRFPVVENWFFACIPNSPFVNAWLVEFMRIHDFTNVDAYIESIRQDTNMQGIPPDLQNYLAMHVAAQRVLQSNLQGQWRTDVISATRNGPFTYLANNEWDSEKAVMSLCTNNNIEESKIIKFRGVERDFVTKHMDHLGCIF